MVNKSHLRLVEKTPERGTAPDDFAREFGFSCRNTDFDELNRLQQEIQAAWSEVEFGHPDHSREAENARSRFKVIEGGRS